MFILIKCTATATRLVVSPVRVFKIFTKCNQATSIVKLNRDLLEAWSSGKSNLVKSKFLILTNRNISSIDMTTFVGLNKLEQLNLDKNHLVIIS